MLATLLMSSILTAYILWNLGGFVDSFKNDPSNLSIFYKFWISTVTFSVVFIGIFGLISGWASIDSWLKGFFVSKESDKLDEVQTAIVALYNQQFKRNWNLDLLTFPENGKQELTAYLLAVSERMEYLKLVDSHKIASRDFFDETKFVARLTIADLSFCFIGNIHLLPDNLQNFVKQQLLRFTDQMATSTRISGLRFFIFFHEILTCLSVDYPKQSRMYVANAIIFRRLLKGSQKSCPYQNINVIFLHECSNDIFDMIEERLADQLEPHSRKVFLDKSNQMYESNYEFSDIIYTLYSEFFFSKPTI